MAVSAVISRIAPQWNTPPAAPAVTGRDVDLWRIDLDRAPADEGALSDDELERARRFHADHHRRWFVAGRTALRAIAGAYLGRSPGAVEFGYSRTGRPHVKGSEGLFDVNLAHSEHAALCAVSGAAAVGVDIEHVKDIEQLAAVAQRSFAASELGELEREHALDGRLETFYRTWTRREAVIKGLGDGLPDALDGGAISELDAYIAARTAARWSVLEFAPLAAYLGAVAVAHDCPVLRCFDYAGGPA